MSAVHGALAGQDPAALRPATHPSLYFIGVSTGHSSIMQVFPAWARHLGLGDVQALARILQERGYWRGTQDLRLLRRYERERKAALAPMGLGMDGLQQLFSRPEAPVQVLRNWGMNGFERFGPLKDWMARQAMGLAQRSQA